MRESDFDPLDPALTCRVHGDPPQQVRAVTHPPGSGATKVRRHGPLVGMTETATSGRVREVMPGRPGEPSE
jgi:hypothetical protein